MSVVRLFSFSRIRKEGRDKGGGWTESGRRSCCFALSLPSAFVFVPPTTTTSERLRKREGMEDEEEVEEKEEEVVEV